MINLEGHTIEFHASNLVIKGVVSGNKEGWIFKSEEPYEILIHSEGAIDSLEPHIDLLAVKAEVVKILSALLSE